MPRKNKVKNTKSAKRGVKIGKKTTTSKKINIKTNISLQSAEVVKLQREFLKIEDEITRHIAARAPKIPFAKPQALSRTYFASHEERIKPVVSSLKRLKRE
ncbi:hypothetical protein KO317_03445 [Candidatus Micrarchaeota archaeon]|nr:hypothetical protein [Candidatus Micrarchaeota archaeon]